jgi:hypothetical protein
MTEKLPHWDPVAAGKAAGEAEKNKPVGSLAARPAGWKPGSRYCPGSLRPPNRGQLERSWKRTKNDRVLSRKLDAVLGKVETEE